MSFADLAQITVHSTVLDFDGAPMTGSVDFIPTAIVSGADDTILFPANVVFTADLDGAGHFEVLLPATDDPDFTPTGWTYRVTERWLGGRVYFISVPFDSAGGRLELPQPAVSSAGMVSYATLADTAGKLDPATADLRYVRPDAAASISGAWDFTFAPTVNGAPIGGGAGGGAVASVDGLTGAVTLTGRYATPADVQTQVAALVNSAPTTLDTLGEIATALQSDESTAAALATTVGGKLTKASNLADVADIPTAKANLGFATVATTGAYADLSGQPTIPAAYSDEQAQDAVAAAFAAGTQTGITVVYDDPGNRISLTVPAGSVPDATTGVKGVVQLAGDLAGTAAAPTVPGKLAKASNLSDVASVPTARTNLGLATVAATGAYADLSGKPTTISANPQTAAYVLTLADAAKSVDVTSATAVAVTVPPSSSVAWVVGTVVEGSQLGAGQVTLTAGAGVTVRTASSLTTRALYSTWGLRYLGSDVWLASGDLT